LTSLARSNPAAIRAPDRRGTSAAPDVRLLVPILAVVVVGRLAESDGPSGPSFNEIPFRLSAQEISQDTAGPNVHIVEDDRTADTQRVLSEEPIFEDRGNE
jgi:hypothetical protein